MYSCGMRILALWLVRWTYLMYSVGYYSVFIHLCKELDDPNMTRCLKRTTDSTYPTHTNTIWKVQFSFVTNPSDHELSVMFSLNREYMITIILSTQYRCKYGSNINSHKERQKDRWDFGQNHTYKVCLFSFNT